MLKTRFCELLDIELPIICAGMGGVALAELAAAVSEAGGLGTVALAGLLPEAIYNEIGAARAHTAKPLAINLLVPFLQPGLLDHALKQPIDAVVFFWGEDPQPLIAAVKAAGKLAIWQCGSAQEARRAGDAGADAVIAQGVEAGGHVRGTTTSLALIPAVRDAIGDLPMVAAGGFADGRGLAAALALGADGCVFGTRFLASRECAAHPLYKRRIVEANAEQTYYTKLFDVGWPDAAHRVLRTKVVDEWEKAGQPASGKRPGEGKVTGRSTRAGVELPLVRYSVAPPAVYFEGDIEEMALYAGQSCNLVNSVRPAAEIVRTIAAEARDVINQRLAALAR